MTSEPDRAEAVGHAPVLLEQVVAALAPAPGETVLDATVGRGGHALELARRIRPGGTLIAIDRDRGNLEFAGARLAAVFDILPPAVETEIGSPDLGPPLRLVHGDFGAMDEITTSRRARVDCMLADLGVASVHFDDPERGFSFRFDGPLDMRLDRSRGATAAALIDSLSESELAEAIRLLGEEPFAARIARKIAQARESAPISTTSKLAELVREAYGPRARRSRMHPATRTFMALRIAVNDELGSLARLLAAISAAAEAIATGTASWLAPGARVAIVSFHSLEDRAVKHAFASLADRGLATASRRPIEATAEEVAANPRSRSAKLRIATVGVPASTRS